MASSDSPSMAELTVRLARENLITAIHDFDGKRYPDACEHASRCAELSLKALLFHAGHPERSVINEHDVGWLHELALPFFPSLADIESEVEVFAEYSADVRYIDQRAIPPSLPSDTYGKQEAELGIDAAGEILAAAETILRTVEAAIEQQSGLWRPK